MPDNGDSGDWRNEVRQDRQESDDTGHDRSSSNWLDEMRDGRKDTTETGDPSLSASDAPTTGLSIPVNRFVCEDCGTVTGPTHHSRCGAPLVLINDEWRCPQCNRHTAPVSSCSKCGASSSDTTTNLGLQLNLDVRPSDIEMAAHEETNRRRSDSPKDLNRLAYDQHLSAIALQHSRDMAQRDYTEHISPEGDGPADRYRRFGHDDRSYGENIARTNHDITASAQEIGQEIVEEWFNSEGHRENLLRDSFQKEGIGIYIDSDGVVYATQNFY